MNKVICYANLNSFNSSDKITDEHMKRYFESLIDGDENQLVGVVIDRCEPYINCNKREGWNKVISACESGAADMIMVPTSSMVTPYVVDLVSIVRDLKFKYDSSINFIRERLCSADPNVEQHLQIHAMLEEDAERMKKSEREMRKSFFTVNGIEGDISAVPVLIDNKKYEKVEEFGRAFGTDAQGLITWFYDAVIDPENYDMFEEMMGMDNGEDNQWDLKGI